MAELSRKGALSVLGSLAAAPALSTGALAQEADLRVSVVPAIDVAPIYAAQALGYFAREGVTVSTQASNSGAVGIPALLGGSFDIVYSNAITVALAILRGIDLRIILEGTPMISRAPDPGGPLVALRGSPIRTGKDLEGKTVACNALRAMMWAIEFAWIKTTGGDAEKVQFQELPLPLLLDAVKSKKADAAILLEPFATMGLSDPTIEVLAWPFSQVFANGAIALWVTTPQTAGTRAPKLRAFLRGYRAGVAWVNANLGKPQYFDLVAGYTKIDRRVLEKMTLVPATVELSDHSFDVLNNLMVETGLIAKRWDYRPSLFT